MSQRSSGFERQSGEQYMTPEWVAETLCHVVNLRGFRVWEPAAGEGAICNVLKRSGAIVTATDIDETFGHTVENFLDEKVGGVFLPSRGPFAIVTNPPYGRGGRLAEAFTRRSIAMTGMLSGIAAMLLPVDWDAAKGRQDLFERFAGHVTKITLTERIRWTNLPQSKSGPSQNHAWFIWDHARHGREMRWLGRIANV